MPEPRSPWVVALSGTMALRCERCGEEYQPKLPCPVALYVAMAHKFEEIHRECKPHEAKL